jgi:hypothetical protein
MAARRTTRFDAELVEGHKGVVVALVPFDPEEAFGQKPVRLAGRRHGWPVRGSLNGVAFDGYVGERWGRFFVIVDEALRDAAGVAAGQRVSLAVAPTSDPTTLERAIAQSKQTTQPSKARADAIAPEHDACVVDARASHDRPRTSRSRPGPRRRLRA